MSLLLLIHHAAFLFSSMDDNSGFEAPDRSPARVICGLDEKEDRVSRQTVFA
jgi:hypothetical protein